MSKKTLSIVKAIKEKAEVMCSPLTTVHERQQLASDIIAMADTLISIIESRNEHARDLYAAHREERRAYLREWRAAHRDECHEYYATHRDEINARARERYAKRKDSNGRT